MIADKPTEPAPKTASDPEGATFSVLSTAPAPVWMPQPSGPASSSGNASGTRTALRSVTSASVANDDCWKNAPRMALSASASVNEPSARCPMKFSSVDSAQL
jgi:hypothetical protein